MTVADLLRAVRARISDPARWTTGAYARNARGHRVGVYDFDATCWCLSGALQCEGRPFGSRGGVEHDAYEMLHRLAVVRGFGTVARLNDEGGHAAVLSVLAEAAR